MLARTPQDPDSAAPLGETVGAEQRLGETVGADSSGGLRSASAPPAVLVLESVVDLDRGAVTVESRVLVDPEPLLVTRVLDGQKVLEKQHMVLPAAVAAAVVEHGVEAARATLQMHHLRYLRRLLSMGTAGTVEPSPVGTLATLVLGPNGEAISRVGEDQVPGSWLRAAYLVTALAAAASEVLEIGPLVGAFLRGVDVRAPAPSPLSRPPQATPPHGPRLEAHFSRDPSDPTGPIRVVYTQNREIARAGGEVAERTSGPISAVPGLPQALFERLVREAAIEAWCAFGDDSGVGEGGALGPNPALAQLATAAATARHLFRDAAPPVAAFELRFAACAVVFLPWGRGVVVVTTATQALSELVEALLRARERMGVGTVFTGYGDRRPSQPPRAPSAVPPSLPAAAAPLTAEAEGDLDALPADFRDALEGFLNAVHGAAKERIGGPVIRNYLKRTKVTSDGVVGGSEVGLDGRISLPKMAISVAEAASVVAWIIRFKEAASSIAPELAELPLRELGGPQAAPLVAARCFGSDGSS